MSKQSDAPVTRRDLHVLSALDNSPLHGYGLVKSVEERSQGAVVFDPANLYRLLRRMSEAGWIQEQQTSGYTRRRTYEITTSGRAILHDEVERLERLIEQLRPAKAGG